MRRAVLCLSIGLLVLSCEAQPLPTQTSLEVAQTVAFITQNAPPIGFDQGVRFAPIDRNLEACRIGTPSWSSTSRAS